MATEFQMVRIDLDLIDRVDEVKDNDMIPRDPYIRQLLEERVEQLEAAKARKKARPKVKRK